MYKLLIILFFPIFCYAQNNDSTYLKEDTSIIRQVKQFVSELYKQGIEVNGDSVYLSEEFKLLKTDSLYRASVCPNVYTWQRTTELLKENNLKHAFWFMINLYSENEKSKDLAMQIFLNYDKIYEMDKILIAAYYTYSFFDPKISTVINGKPEIIRPDLMEKKLNDIKEMIKYILYFRAQRTERQDKFK